MTTTLNKIGFGGGCHWCTGHWYTESVFASLIGLTKVNQGWIASRAQNANFSETVEVFFNPAVMSLKALIEIHLYTRK